jgi:hypothetical protein
MLGDKLVKADQNIDWKKFRLTLSAYASSSPSFSNLLGNLRSR